MVERQWLIHPASYSLQASRVMGLEGIAEGVAGTVDGRLGNAVAWLQVLSGVCVSHSLCRVDAEGARSRWSRRPESLPSPCSLSPLATEHEHSFFLLLVEMTNCVSLSACGCCRCISGEERARCR
jgi:hypothetical protein